MIIQIQKNLSGFESGKKAYLGGED